MTTTLLHAQFTVTGTLVDSLNHDKIFYATVGLMTQDSTGRVVSSTFSDGNGYFEMTNVPAGNYNLRASLVGYEMLELPVTVGNQDKKISLGEVKMLKNSNFLKEVSVKGEKPVYMIDGEKTMYNVAEDPTVQAGTASDALQNAPGVEVDVEGNITLRGVSSVEIWLNNKPSNMNEEALKQFIQQMPAGTIEKIEVITNPSARYSAKGSGGIINIVTTSKIKKNSFLSFGVRGSSMPDVSPFLSYVFANEKFSISAFARYNYRNEWQYLESQSVAFNDARDTSQVMSMTYNHKKKSHGGGLFINGSYTPDTMNMISFWAGTYPSLNKGDDIAQYQWYEYLYNPGDYSFNQSDLFFASGGGGYAGLWYEHKFNSLGHKISTNVGYSGWRHKYQSDILRKYSEMNWLDKKRSEDYLFVQNEVDAALDYTIPYHKNGEIEIGASGHYSFEQNNHRVDTLLLSMADDCVESFNLDELRSFECLTQTGSVAAYATLQHRFGHFTMKGGLRTETEMFGMQYVDNDQYNSSKVYFGLFPSLHLSYRTESMHNFKLSYSRRVQNPSADDLTLFVTYGEDDLSKGNPELKQAYTNAIEAGWSKFFNKFGNVSVDAYFKNTKDEFSNLSDVIFDPYFGRIVSFSQPINAGKNLNTGVELSMMYRLKSFMNIRFYANVFYKKSSFDFRDDNTYTVDNLGYSFRLNFWAKMWKVLELNASANYRSKTKTLFSTTLPTYSIDCGLRAQFWKQRITLHVDVRDIFNWNKMSEDNNNPYYTVSSTHRNSWFGRTIRAGIEFKFGRMELESMTGQGNAGQPDGGMMR